MLELRNLTKIYKNKVSADVKALDNISLKFPETGMVFLLGKSGSGKSTLLNVCGGLDNPTSGEIIVKGRSSKNFSQSDFDSYRNTFVGFIFQEYNILNEFSVYDNIALALELQDKEVNNNIVEELLEKVDLKDYGKRKPNTLSGGQKQRIAIARALIKNPEIIMADEPTGALDSQTGIQVLDTLKKLSKDTLVIVVSHDREFALNYGDRIIELKDGKVISDISKTSEKQNEISKNVSIVGDTLSIKSGSNLSQSDFDCIKEFITSTKNDLVLSKNDKDIEALKRSAKINKLGEKEVFKDTDKNALVLKEYKEEESRFIKSKLPMRHAFKIGISSMKHKPFRLFMTVVLVSVAFMLFGLLSTMMFYSSENTFKDTLIKSDYKYMKIGKLYKVNNESYSNGEKTFEYTDNIPTTLSEKDYQELKDKYGSNVFYSVYTGISYSAQKTFSRYYKTEIANFGYIESDNDIYSTIVGEYPKNDDEILLSTYIVDTMINNIPYDGTGNSITLKTREDIIGKSIKFVDSTYKVVGYFDSGEVSSKYDVLKEKNDTMLENDYDYYLRDELHSLAFVTKNRLEIIAQDYKVNYDDLSMYTSVVVKSSSEDIYEDYASYSYIEYEDNMKDGIIKFTDKDKFGENDAYVNMSAYAALISNRLEFKCKYDSNYCDSDLMDLLYSIQIGGISNDYGYEKYTPKELVDAINKVRDKIDLQDFNISFRMFNDYDEQAFGEDYNINVVGIYINYDQVNNSRNNLLILNEKLFDKVFDQHSKNLPYYTISKTDYVATSTLYENVYVPYDGTEEATNEFWNLYSNKKYNDDDSKLYLSSLIVDNVAMIDEIVSILYKVFLYAGIVLCIFAILLFSNFISISISNKTKEIGILRAVGARGMDVFKIFFSESFVITIMCLAISFAGCFTVCNILNEILNYGVGVSIFVFGILSVIILIMIGAVTSFVATFLPVKKAARKKPVESIRAI